MTPEELVEDRYRNSVNRQLTRSTAPVVAARYPHSRSRIERKFNE